MVKKLIIESGDNMSTENNLADDFQIDNEQEYSKNDDDLIGIREQLEADKKLIEADKIAVREKLVYVNGILEAVNMGVPTSRVERFVKMSDLSKIKIDDEGQVDIKNMREALLEVAREFPEFLSSKNKASGGANPGAVGVMTKSEEYVEKVNNARRCGDQLSVIRLKREAALEGIFIQ